MIRFTAAERPDLARLLFSKSHDGERANGSKTDRTTRIPSGVASPLSMNHAVKGSVFVNLKMPATYKIGLAAVRPVLKLTVTTDILSTYNLT